jgi:hypothetical protein
MTATWFTYTKLPALQGPLCWELVEVRRRPMASTHVPPANESWSRRRARALGSAQYASETCQERRQVDYEGVTVHHRQPVGPIIRGQLPNMPYWTRDAEARSYAVVDLSTYHTPLLGRQAAKSTRPSLSYPPTSGLSPDVPHWIRKACDRS